MDERGLLVGIEWAGIREQQGRIVELGMGLGRDIAAGEPVLESVVAAPEVGVVVERTDRSQVQVQVGRNHLVVSLGNYRILCSLHC